MNIEAVLLLGLIAVMYTAFIIVAVGYVYDGPNDHDLDVLAEVLLDRLDGQLSGMVEDALASLDNTDVALAEYFRTHCLHVELGKAGMGEKYGFHLYVIDTEKVAEDMHGVKPPYRMNLADLAKKIVAEVNGN